MFNLAVFNRCSGNRRRIEGVIKQTDSAVGSGVEGYRTGGSPEPEIGNYRRVVASKNCRRILQRVRQRRTLGSESAARSTIATVFAA